MKISLSMRLIIIVSCSVIGLLMTALFSLYTLRSNMMEDRKEEIRVVLNLAARQVAYFQSLESHGTLSRSEAQRQAIAAITSLREGRNLYVWIRRTDGVGLVQQGPQDVGKVDFGKHLPDGRTTFQRYLDDLSTSPYAFGQVFLPKDGTDAPVLKINGVTKVDGWNWVLGFGVWADDIGAAFWRGALHFLLLGGAVVLVTIGLAVLLSRSIYRTLGGEPEYAAQVMHDIADGNISTNLIGNFPNASLLASMQTMQNRLRLMIEKIQGSAGELDLSATRLSDLVVQINIAAQESESSTASTAAAVEELAVSIDHISSSATQTEKNSARASDIAVDGEVMVVNASETISDVASMITAASVQIETLLDRSKEIGSIANVIKEIADQTNLLALNAAIEAARAGEQGRGFAVVADEVRKLAERTTRATDEISQMIGSIQSNTEGVVVNMQDVLPRVEKSVDLAKSAAISLREISQGAAITLSDVKAVTSATAEQSQASASVAQNIERIAQMLESSSISATKANDEVKVLETLSQELRSSVSKFRV
jgi:methyl-accepting chemotaxis protein